MVSHVDELERRLSTASQELKSSENMRLELGKQLKGVQQEKE